MKTVDEFYEEIRWNKELWEGFSEAVKEGRAEAFMKEHVCDATFEELTSFLQSRQKDREDIEQMSLEELENVTGGFPTLAECVAACMLADVYVAWLHEWCPKCGFYFSN